MQGNTLEKFCITYNALHVFVYKSHLTFWAISYFFGTKNAAYARINTIFAMQLLD